MNAQISAVDRVEVNGVRLAYTQCGQGSDVVFLHGWMCDRTFWQRQCRELAGAKLPLPGGRLSRAR